MKTLRFYLVCISILLCLFGMQSCQQELIDPDSHASEGVEMIFTAVSEGQTKTNRQEDKTVWWSPSEEINVFYGDLSSSKFVSMNEEPSPVVQFKGSLDAFTGSNEQNGDMQYFYAIYPYSFDNKCADDVLTLSVPHQQTAVANTFDNGMFPSVAKSSGLDLSFYNVCGGIKFSLSRNDIKKIALSGNRDEVIAGKTTVSFDSDGVPVVDCVGDKTTIYLSPRESSTFSADTYYYITLPPVVFDSGIKMTFYTTGNKEGVLQTDNSIEIKRSVFASKDNIDSDVTEWTDIITPAGTESGFYLGVIGFNGEMYSYPITYLSAESKGSFDEFIESMTMSKGTVLYYSVDSAISAFQSAALPEDVFNVAIVTFTDGLDEGSIMKQFDYLTEEEYLEGVNHKLLNEKVSGQNISAYSIGLVGNDIKNSASLEVFRNNLLKLASSPDNAYEVQNFAEVNEKFQEIADKLDENSYVQKLSVCIPGQGHGTKVRFTFDNVSDASLSQLYIEGVFNLRERSLEQVEYCGFTSTSGTVVKGEVDGIFVTFTFEGVHTPENELVAQEYIKHWNYVASNSSWQVNSEFVSDESSSIVNEKKSSAIMLVLDCSSSLGDQFENLKEHAKSFVYNLYKSSSIESDDIYPVYPSDYLSTTPLDLSLAVARNGVRYYVPQSEYPKLNLSAYIVEGLTVVSGDEAFIMALDQRPVGALVWSFANMYYELPDYNEGVVISARFSDINNALAFFGGTKLGASTAYWTQTSYSGSEYYYYIYDSKGSLSHTSKTTRLRQVISLDEEEGLEIPYIFDKYDELTLSVTDGTERRFISLDEYQRGGVPAGYIAEGLAIRSKHENFIISLTDESSDPMYYSAAVQLYGDKNFPTISQCQIIDSRQEEIENALVSFGGKELKNTIAVKDGSYYYYIPSYSDYQDGRSYYSSTNSARYVRLIVDTF